MMKIKSWDIFFFASFVLLSVGIKGAAASPYLDIPEIPLFIHFFLLTNIFQLSVAIVMIQEVKKVSASPVWNNIVIGNLFTMIDALTLGILLYKYTSILNKTTSIIIALLYTYAVFMINIGEYLLIKPLLKEKIKLMKMEYIFLYVFLPPLTCLIFTKSISLVEFGIFKNANLIFLFIILFVFVILYSYHRNPWEGIYIVLQKSSFVCYSRA